MRAISVVFFAGAPTLVLGLVLFSLRAKLVDNWRAIAFLAAGSMLFFHRILFFGEALSQSDANLLQLQFFAVYKDAILSFGEIPFWNPSIGAGLPNLANPLSAMFYPLAPLFLVMDIFRAMGIFVVCHYVLAGTFALLFARRVFRTRQAALVFAILYAFNGWAVTRAAQQPAIEYLLAYAWLPLAALAFEEAIDGRSMLWAVVAGGSALAWMGMACPNLFVYACLLLAACLAIRSAVLAASKRWNALAVGFVTVVGCGAFAFVLGAVEYAPARELAGYSTASRLGENLPAGWRGQALSPAAMLELYFPYVPGRPFGVYYSPGVLALCLALFGAYSAVSAKVHRGIALGAVVVLVFAAALLSKSPVYGWVAGASNLFARSSLIPAGLVLLVLPAAALAACGLEGLIETRRSFFGWRSYALAGIVYLELFVGLGVIYPGFGERRLNFDYAKELADFPHLDKVASEDGTGRILVESPTEGQVIAPSYAVLSRGLSRLNLHLADFAPDWLEGAVDAASAEMDPQTLAVLGVKWVASAGELESLGEPEAIGWPGADKHYEDNIFFPLRHEAGWLAWNRVVCLYRLPGAAVVRGEPPTRQSLVAGSSGVVLEELLTKKPADFSNWTPMPIYHQTANTLTVVLPEGAVTRLFAAVTAYPGWRVFADDAEVSYVTAAGAFLAVDVPPDTKVVRFEFEPTRWNGWLALAALAVACSVIAVGRETAPTGAKAR